MDRNFKLKRRIISVDETLMHALKLMDTTGFRLLVVLDSKDLFAGILSIGDIQRTIIQNKSLETPIIEVLRENIRVAKPEDSFDSIKQMMLEFRMEFCPVVNEKREVTDIYFWEDLFIDKKPRPTKRFEIPVVIMAGGLGTRLKPLTNVLPKPLIPIAETTIIEEIFKRFANHGCNHFLISLNYKADLIEYYLEHQNLPYKIEYFRESKPMGTAGSLSLLKEKISNTFFVSNCDILIEQDYSEILEYHYSNKNLITIVSALKNYPIPYGVLVTGGNGDLVELQEKPEMIFKINSGMYILEKDVLSEIPEQTFFHITELIERIKKKGGKVGGFPVSEKSWKDLGSWEEYLKHII